MTEVIRISGRSLIHPDTSQYSIIERIIEAECMSEGVRISRRWSVRFFL